MRHSMNVKCCGKIHTVKGMFYPEWKYCAGCGDQWITKKKYDFERKER